MHWKVYVRFTVLVRICIVAADVQDLLDKAGKSEALGPLDDNDPDAAGEEEEQAATDDLADQLAAASIK